MFIDLSTLTQSTDLWNVYGECENYVVMKGHSGAIMEVQYSTDGRSGPLTGSKWERLGLLNSGFTTSVFRTFGDTLIEPQGWTGWAG